MATEALVPATVTPMELLQSAINQNLDIDKLSKLLELQLRWEANEARKAYVEAMNAFKSNPPKILKNRHVHFDGQKGPIDYDHATLDHVCNAVTKALSEHGISHRWRMDEDRPDWIKVTCILTHKHGHSEESSQGGPPDTSGSKNAIQARGSSVTYLQRYTLLAATGLAPSNDMDGKVPSEHQIPDERFVELQDWIANANDDAELKELYQKACKEAGEDSDAKRRFNQAKNERYRELHNAGR